MSTGTAVMAQSIETGERTLQSRFWTKVDKSGECWLWLAAKGETGYGHISVGRTCRMAHRVSYELLVGPIPQGLHLDHLCRVRACVNPAHLEPVTCAENVRRGARSVRPTCAAGHVLVGDTVRIGEAGHRICRECRRLRQVRRRAELKAQALEFDAMGAPDDADGAS